jgi:hypothetical protein
LKARKPYWAHVRQEWLNFLDCRKSWLASGCALRAYIN